MKWQQWDWTASAGLLNVNLYFKIFDIKCHFCLKMRIEEIGPKNKFQHVQSCSGPKEQFKTVHHQSKCPSKTQCPLYSSKGNIVVWDFWFPSVHHKKEKPKRLVIFPTIDQSEWQNNYSYKDNWRQDKKRQESIITALGQLRMEEEEEEDVSLSYSYLWQWKWYSQLKSSITNNQIVTWQ